jgi:hypothetical protein
MIYYYSNVFTFMLALSDAWKISNEMVLFLSLPPLR